MNRGEDTQFTVFEEGLREFKSFWRGEFPVDMEDREIDMMLRQAMSAGIKMFLKMEDLSPGYHKHYLEPYGYKYTPKESKSIKQSHRAEGNNFID